MNRRLGTVLLVAVGLRRRFLLGRARRKRVRCLRFCSGGDHKNEEYRQRVGRLLTLQNRPDLAGVLTDKERQALAVFVRAQEPLELSLQWVYAKIF